jgi:isopropylmalate/homocitrate/citramalate synthase
MDVVQHEKGLVYSPGSFDVGKPNRRGSAMTDLPRHVDIHEEGPREGFQIEPGPISTTDKIRLIDALSQTGLRHIQVCSFVNPRLVPGWADAEAVVAGFAAKGGIDYTGLWFNASGLERALAFRGKLTISGAIALCASDAFTRKNLNRSHADNVVAMRKQTALHKAHGVAVTRIGVMAAFGCNYQGDIAPAQVLRTLEDGLSIAADAGEQITQFSLADTMGWATPARIERVLGEVRARWPDKQLSLHLHDTRGLAVANAHAGLRMGVARFDATVGGLGGCPFAGQKGAAGNICTEELVLLCEEMGIGTGVDLDRLIEVGRMAEDIVGHVLPSELIHAGSLNAFRRKAA